MGATNNISKSFLINRSEIEGRIDPHQFHIERREAIDKIKRNNEVLKLKHVVKNVKTTTTDIGENDIYIGLENIESNTGEYVATNEKQSISSAGVFKAGQILFPKLRPYLNKVYLAEFNGLCSTEFHIFKSDIFSNEFLSIYLRSDLIVNQTKHLMTGNTLPRLQTEDINNLPVPNLDIDKQNKIVELYSAAKNQKQQKEAHAQEILKNIDTYLLNELGIVVPQKDNSIANRIFTINFSKVVGNRLDPDYNHIYYLNFIKQLSNKYESKNLKEISIDIFQGVGRDLVDESNFTLLKVKNIKKGNKIDFDDTEFVRSVPKNKILQNNDIISPFIGEAIRQIKFSIFKSKSTHFTVDNNTGVIRINDNLCNANYICELLNSKIGEIQILKLIGGGGVPFLGSNSVKEIYTPLPPIEKQIEIVNHIQEIRQQAKQLQEDAKIILDKAKQEVEKMIIGN
jgi:restriction endonuclease S subunit